MYFGRIHQKILKFRFLFFQSNVSGVLVKSLRIKVLRLVTSEFYSILEGHRRSAYEKNIYMGMDLSLRVYGNNLFAWHVSSIWEWTFSSVYKLNIGMGLLLIV